MIWQHGIDELKNFLVHLNAILEQIQFTREVEETQRLPFLDVLVMKRPDGTLGHTVYRKPTHTSRYLNAASHHHPAQLASVANTLAVRSTRIADKEHIAKELHGLRQDLEANGFSSYTVAKAFSRKKTRHNEEIEQEKPRATAFLPYVRGSTDKISNLLKSRNIKTIFKPDRKIASMLRSP